MKLSLNWIREYVDLPQDISLTQLSHDLTMRTVEVEDAEDLALAYHQIVVGKILTVEPHPGADRLRVCQVDVGVIEPVQIVCGGSNLYEGELVVVALPGSHVVWHGEGEKVEIKRGKLRGVESFGMICGANEVGIDALFPSKDDHEIVDLTGLSEARPGINLAEALNLNDIILEIDNKSMTNRPDLWGHYGIARELAAIYRQQLRPLPELTIGKDLPEFPVVIKEKSKCARYTATVIENVRVEKSPYWLRLKLWKVGIRPINNLVDLTNYVMLATGQPTHGFDFHQLHGGISVRSGQEGETLTLLDETELKLSPEDLLIADDIEAIALAGVMGGAKDSILPGTNKMILEAANFSASSVRKTTQRHMLRTEASVRFEKSIDSARIDAGLCVFFSLLKTLLPEAYVVAHSDVSGERQPDVTVTVPLAYLTKRLGRAVNTDMVQALLNPLGFHVTENAGGVLSIQVPSYRATGDISLKDDILEEVARMIGYENFDFIPPTVTLTPPPENDRYRLERSMKETLAFRFGFQEVFTYPWVEDEFMAAAGISSDECLRLSEPPAPDCACLRSSLIPGLLKVCVENLRYYESFRVFELTQVFKKGEFHPSCEEEALPLHEKTLACALIGSDPVELFRHMKGVAENLPALVQVKSYTFKQIKKPEWADGQGWLNLCLEDRVIGSLGAASVKTLKLSGIKRANIVFLEMNIDALCVNPSRDNHFTHLPQYPLTEQDLNILVSEDVTWELIASTVRSAVKKIRFIEEYRGTGVPQGKKSILFRYWLGKDDGTLSSEEIDQAVQSIVKKLNKRLGAEVKA